MKCIARINGIVHSLMKNPHALCLRIFNIFNCILHGRFCLCAIANLVAVRVGLNM